MLKRQVMADRRVLKAEWQTAKDELIELTPYTETCEPVAEEPVVDKPAVEGVVVPAP